MIPLIGEGIARVDGLAKLTGEALFTGDLECPGALHAALVLSRVASGRILRIDDVLARRSAGVIDIITHQNMEPLVDPESRLFLQDGNIRHAGQPVAVVVATTLHEAREAASLVQVDVESFPAVTSIEGAVDQPFEPVDGCLSLGPADSSRGDMAKGFADSQAIVEQVYVTPTHNHLPIEPHAAIAEWADGQLTVRTTTQTVFTTRNLVARALNIALTNVRVISRYVGGGFCSKGRTWWPGLMLSIVASRRVGRPVRLELRREEMFTAVGNRQPTIQTVRLGATAAGRLAAIQHDTIARMSMVGEYSDPNSFPSRLLYACPNVATSHRLVRGNVPRPVAMRAPGEGTGTFALESAMDELAFKLGMDPLEFRIQNYAGYDQHENRPWSSNGLLECYRVASNAFGWNRRSAVPRSMRNSRTLTGWGMASAYYPVYQASAQVTATMLGDGRVIVRCGTQDTGTGTCTAIAQLAAEALGISVSRIDVELGDTSLPEGPPSAGSMGAASFTPAVLRAAGGLRSMLVAKAASDPASVLFGSDQSVLEIAGDSIRSAHGGPSESIAALMAREPSGRIEALGSAEKPQGQRSYSSNSYGAVFADVQVDEDLSTIRLTRLVAAYAAGRILNAQMARSQYLGGLVFGIGMALHEETRFDPASGVVTNRNLTDYLVPTHADMPDFDIHLIEESDDLLDNGGVKGIGMIGTIGTAAAIANAVFHATGVRCRKLPIRIEDFATHHRDRPG
ncbi:MAG TPA: xanthine dehydrogenase family protein molybdopterin-binding subunit [Bryobacteraceae bacterium]|nr:xanthine dehydrogenase family protein molybdopterin-binding subunit [Bryobacteraceae bacterium]